jgi:hypothetical protein
MRMNKKLATGVAAGVIVVAGAGTALAYWTSSGSGDGSATTSAGNAAAISVSGNYTGDIYPGLAPQNFTATVANVDKGVRQ